MTARVSRFDSFTARLFSGRLFPDAFAGHMHRDPKSQGSNRGCNQQRFHYNKRDEHGKKAGKAINRVYGEPE